MKLVRSLNWVIPFILLPQFAYSISFDSSIQNLNQFAEAQACHGPKKTSIGNTEDHCLWNLFQERPFAEVRQIASDIQNAVHPKTNTCKNNQLIEQLNQKIKNLNCMDPKELFAPKPSTEEQDSASPPKPLITKLHDSTSQLKNVLGIISAPDEALLDQGGQKLKQTVDTAVTEISHQIFGTMGDSCKYQLSDLVPNSFNTTHTEDIMMQMEVGYAVAKALVNLTTSVVTGGIPAPASLIESVIETASSTIASKINNDIAHRKNFSHSLRPDQKSSGTPIGTLVEETAKSMVSKYLDSAPIQQAITEVGASLVMKTAGNSLPIVGMIHNFTNIGSSYQFANQQMHDLDRYLEALKTEHSIKKKVLRTIENKMKEVNGLINQISQSDQDCRINSNACDKINKTMSLLNDYKDAYPKIQNYLTAKLDEGTRNTLLQSFQGSKNAIDHLSKKNENLSESIHNLMEDENIGTLKNSITQEEITQYNKLCTDIKKQLPSLAMSELMDHGASFECNGGPLQKIELGAVHDALLAYEKALKIESNTSNEVLIKNGRQLLNIQNSISHLLGAQQSILNNLAVRFLDQETLANHSNSFSSNSNDALLRSDFPQLATSPDLSEQKGVHKSKTLKTIELTHSSQNLKASESQVLQNISDKLKLSRKINLKKLEQRKLTAENIEFIEEFYFGKNGLYKQFECDRHSKDPISQICHTFKTEGAATLVHSMDEAATVFNLVKTQFQTAKKDHKPWSNQSCDQILNTSESTRQAFDRMNSKNSQAESFFRMYCKNPNTVGIYYLFKNTKLGNTPFFDVVPSVSYFHALVDPHNIENEWDNETMKKAKRAAKQQKVRKIQQNLGAVTKLLQDQELE